MNEHGCADFIKAIAGSYREQSHRRISKSHFISVMADGSTDSSVIEQEAVYIRYVYEGQAKTELLQLIDVEHSTSQGVLAGIYKALDLAGIGPEVQKKKLVGLNLDGASVNMGIKNGVQRLMKDILPQILVNHCINHNLELAVLDLKKSEEHLQNFETTVKNIFNFYHWSPKRRRELSNIAVDLNEKLLRFGGLKQIRWLSSQKRATEQLTKNLNITIIHSGVCSF